MRKAVEQYLAHLALANASENTIRSYRGYLLEFASLCPVEAFQVDVDHIEQYLAVLGRRQIAKATLGRVLATVKSFCEWLVGEGLLRENPAEAFRGPRRSHHVHCGATEQEIRSLLDGPIRTSFPERDRLILELLYGSGLRCQELASLLVSDFVDQDVLLVSKGKGNKQRRVLLTDCARVALVAYLAKRKQILDTRMRKGDMRKITSLFFARRGRQINALDPRSIRRIVVTLARDAGLPWLRPHDLRRAFATHMDQHGAPRIVISRLLGHSRQSITDVYIAKASPERLKMAYDRARASASHLTNQKIVDCAGNGKAMLVLSSTSR